MVKLLRSTLKDVTHLSVPGVDGMGHQEPGYQ